jgi:hypothetical protein
MFEIDLRVAVDKCLGIIFTETLPQSFSPACFGGGEIASKTHGMTGQADGWRDFSSRGDCLNSAIAPGRIG